MPRHTKHGKRRNRQINFDRLLRDIKKEENIKNKPVERLKVVEEVIKPKEIEAVSMERRMRSSKLDNKLNADFKVKVTVRPEEFILNNDLFKIFKKNVYDEFTVDELEEFKKVHYRVRREQICFPYINRGQLWYHHLKSSQITELNDWYEAWLDVTETLSEPNTPIWLNDKINKIETEELL